MNSLTFPKKSDADATFHQEIVFKKNHTNKQTKSKTNAMHENSTNFFRTQRFQFWREITCGHSTETLPHERIWCSTGKQAGRIRISQTLSRKEAYGRIQQRLPVGVNILVWSSTSTRATHVFSRDTRVLTFWFTCKYHGSRPFFLDIPSVAIKYRDTNNFTV